LAGKLIEIKAEKSKSAQRRLVTITDNLLAWLAPYARKAGPVIDLKRLRIAREKTAKEAKIKWPANVLRHSFASYHLAHYNNAASTATQIGHMSPVMLYRHYRELVRPDVAAQWWQVMPPTLAGNLVAFGA